MESKRMSMMPNTSITPSTSKDSALEIRPINSTKTNTQVKNMNRDALEIRPISMMSSVHQIQNAMLQAQHNAHIHNTANLANVQFQNAMLQMQQNPHYNALMQYYATGVSPSLEIKPISGPPQHKGKGPSVDISRVSSAQILNSSSTVKRVQPYASSTVTSKDVRLEPNKRPISANKQTSSTITSKDIEVKKVTAQTASCTISKETKEVKRAKLHTISQVPTNKEAKTESKKVTPQLQTVTQVSPSKEAKTETKRLSSQGTSSSTNKNGKAETKRLSVNNVLNNSKESKADSKKSQQPNNKSTKSESKRALLQSMTLPNKYKEIKEKDKEKDKEKNKDKDKEKEKDPKKIEKSITTSAIRFNLKLSESNETEYPIFNYSDMVKDAEKKRRKEKKKDERGMSNGNAFDDDDDEKVLDVARYYEEKYGRGKKRDNVDLGAGYDEEDSFIDNTDAYDEVVPEEVTTAHGGFYVNSGPLEFKNSDKAKMRKDQEESEESSDDDEDEESSDDDEEDDDEDSEKESDDQESKSKKSKRALSSDDSTERSTPPPKSKPRTSTDNSDCILVD